MKGAGWYFMQGGRKLWAETKAEIRQLAKAVADRTGKPVKVRPGGRPGATSAPKKRPLKRVAARSMRRNPDPGSFLPVWNELERHRKARLAFLEATKGRRLAKGLRGRGDRAVRAAERGAEKSGKFSIDGHGKINGRPQKFKLYRASRKAADALADQFRAAGFTVSVGEA